MPRTKNWPRSDPVLIRQGCRIFGWSNRADFDEKRLVIVWRCAPILYYFCGFWVPKKHAFPPPTFFPLIQQFWLQRKGTSFLFFFYSKIFSRVNRGSATRVDLVSNRPDFGAKRLVIVASVVFEGSQKHAFPPPTFFPLIQQYWLQRKGTSLSSARSNDTKIFWIGTG